MIYLEMDGQEIGRFANKEQAELWVRRMANLEAAITGVEEEECFRGMARASKLWELVSVENWVE
jgi:hypothetical protein